MNLGGDDVTNDIAYILNKTRAVAEQIKQESGHSYVPSVSNEEMIIIPQVGGCPPSRCPSAGGPGSSSRRTGEEIFSLLLDAFSKEHGARASVGNRAGGGALSGVTDLAGGVFQDARPARFPEAIGGWIPKLYQPIYDRVGFVEERKRTSASGKPAIEESGTQAQTQGPASKLRGFFKDIV